MHGARSTMRAHSVLVLYSQVPGRSLPTINGSPAPQPRPKSLHRPITSPCRVTRSSDGLFSCYQADGSLPSVVSSRTSASSWNSRCLFQLPTCSAPNPILHFSSSVWDPGWISASHIVPRYVLPACNYKYICTGSRGMGKLLNRTGCFPPMNDPSQRCGSCTDYNPIFQALCMSRRV